MLPKDQTDIDYEQELKQLRKLLELEKADHIATKNALTKYEEKFALLKTETSEFAYIASHDLQEPLRKLTSFSKLLEKRAAEKLDDSDRKYLEFIMGASERMSELLNSLLDYSRVSSEKSKPTLVNLSSLVDMISEKLNSAEKSKNPVITHENLPSIFITEKEINRIFFSLVENGIKFNTSPTPEIHISHRQDLTHHIFTIKDNGIGIAEKYCSKIFILFQRLHSKKDYTGVGAGLAICKKMIDKNGGQLWVESQLDKGSVFYFTLPKVAN